jgi:hypothetical protein
MSLDASLLPPNADTPGLFPKKRMRWLVGLAIFGFLGALLIAIIKDDTGVPAPSATPQSESAIGHKAFVTFIESMNVTTGFSVGEMLSFVGVDQLTMLLEPDPEAISFRDLPRRMDAKTVLLVLPKWVDEADKKKPRWLVRAGLMERAAVQEMADTIVGGVDIVRLTTPVAYTRNDYRNAPTLSRPQLMQSGRLTPIIASAEGILLGSIKRGRSIIYVLSDPDLLNNHGLDNGNNAALILGIVNKLRGDGGVSIDFGIYPHISAKSMWRRLVEPPLVGISLLLLGSLMLLMWHASTRFGQPQSVPPPLERGKLALIANSAALFQTREHSYDLLERYLDLQVQELLRQQPQIARLSGEARMKSLDHLSVVRGTAQRFTALDAMVKARHLDPAHLAKDIYTWKQEIALGNG